MHTFNHIALALLVLIMSCAICAAKQTALSPEAAKTLDTLWSMDVARQTPYDIEIISSKTDGDYKTDQFYISSAPVKGRAPDRLLVTFSRIVKPGVKSAAYLSLTAGDTPTAVRWLAGHLRCAAVDIEYRNASLPVRSKWAVQNNMNPWAVTPAVTDCFVYSFIMGCRRVIDYISEQPEIDKSHIGAGGGSFGGWYALLIAAVDTRVDSVCDTYACGSQGNRCGAHTLAVSALPPDQKALWIASFDPTTFAANNKATTLMIMGTDDYSFWLCDALHQYDILPGNKRLVLLPNYNHNMSAFDYKAPDLFGAWLVSMYGGDPQFPTITDPVAAKDMYTFQASGSVPIDHAILYWSPGEAGSKVWPARYWMPFDAQLEGGVWKATLPQPYAALSGLVYATVFDQKGRAASSRMVTRTGEDPATGKAGWKDGALWDIERGPGAWRIPGGGKRQFVGAFKAEAVGADGLKITTAADGKFAFLTDSVQLSSPVAKNHRGVRLIIDGNGQAGHLRVSLDQKAGSFDEVAFVHELDYPAGVATFDIPWADFQAPGDEPGPIPYDAMRFEGTRTGQTPLVLQSIAFLE